MNIVDRVDQLGEMIESNRNHTRRATNNKAPNPDYRYKTVSRHLYKHPSSADYNSDHPHCKRCPSRIDAR